MGELRIGNTIIPYEEIYSTRAKKIRITVANDKVSVTVPKGADLEMVRKFIEAKKEWIFKHVEDYRQHAEGQVEIPRKEYVAGEKFLYMGRELMLRTIAYNEKYTSIKLDSTTIWIYISDTVPKEVWSQVVKEALLYFYKNQAKKIFKEKLDHYARVMGLKYNDLRVKEQKTRWGSCSSKGNINLNWRAILAPNQVIDYLVIHELAHLKHLNHSKDFWCLVANYIPDYKRWEQWLKENSKLLIV